MFEISIANRYFFGKNSSRIFLKIINAISILGVAVGVTTLIVVLGVMNGFDDYLQSKIVGVTSHILLSKNYGKHFNYSEALSGKLKQRSEIEAFSPVFIDNAMIRSDYSSFAVAVKGIVPETDKYVTQIYSSLQTGKKLYRSDSRGVFLGYYLAQKLGVKTDDEITLIPAQITFSAFGVIPGAARLKVLGIFKTGMFEYDSSFAYLPLTAAQNIFRKLNTITNIEIKLKNPDSADKTSVILNEFLNFEYYSNSWITMNRNLFAALKLEKTVMFIILTLIIAVAALNIASSIIVLIVEKTREIGILRAIGVSKKSISIIFLLKGLLIGIIGAGSGLIMGLLLSYIISRYNITIPGDVYYIEKLPIKTEFGDIAIICITAVFICLASSVYPALRAAKLEPVEAIRNE